MLRQLSFETLKHVDDGRIKAAWDQHLERVLNDIADLPGVSDAREVHLVLRVSPDQVEQGVCENVRFGFTIKSKVPVRKSRVYDAQLRANGMAAFNDLSAEDADQRTLDELPGWDESAG